MGGGALAMAASLVIFQWITFWGSVFRSMFLAGRLLSGRKPEGTGTVNGEEQEEEGFVDFAMYEGVVWHERKQPIHHKFEYKVRYAFVNLDKSPSWFASSSGHHHMTAGQVRSLVGTSGPVHLLCMPTSVGYEQNPISVYYCYDDAGGPHRSLPVLSKTIAEVTNTPWGERVTFTFDSNDGVAKPLHVSPFMDMKGTWRIHAPAPGEKLYLTVEVEHPDYGRFFLATLRARKVDQVLSPEQFLWLMPHKVAIWIYWQALVLLWKGVTFVQHPKYIDGALYRARAQDRDAELRLTKEAGPQVANSGTARVLCPRLCKWRDANGYPWL